MAWLTISELRQKFSIQDGRYETQLEAAIDDAAMTIEDGVDSEIYAEAIAGTAPTDPDELKRYNRVVKSHSFLTMWYFVGNVGNKLGETGFVESAQDSSSPAMSARVVTNRYLTPEKIEAMRDKWLANAKRFISPYGTIEVEDEGIVDDVEISLSMSSMRWF